jgi:hypothetical protein
LDSHHSPVRLYLLCLALSVMVYVV